MPQWITEILKQHGMTGVFIAFLVGVCYLLWKTYIKERDAHEVTKDRLNKIIFENEREYSKESKENLEKVLNNGTIFKEMFDKLFGRTET